MRPGRRSFLLGMGATVAGAYALEGQSAPGRATAPGPSLPDPLREPASVTAFAEGRSAAIRLARSGGKWQGNDVEVSTELRKGKNGAEAAIIVTAPKTRLTRIRLRWHGAFPAGWRYLGDHWERSYGDLEWRGLSGERLMPWYFLASNGALTHGYGVKTGAASICCWQADAGGVTLWLDVSNGGGGSRTGRAAAGGSHGCRPQRPRRGIHAGRGAGVLPRDVQEAAAAGQAHLRQQQLVLHLWPESQCRSQLEGRRPDGRSSCPPRRPTVPSW